MAARKAIYQVNSGDGKKRGGLDGQGFRPAPDFCRSVGAHRRCAAKSNSPIISRE